jgi:hypothetical protein
MTNQVFDKYGNELTCKDGRVFLRLNGTSRSRCLGVISGETFYTQRKTEAHLMRTLEDIGFNWHLIKRGTFNKVVVEISDGRILRTTREHILQCGSTKFFKNQGFELQIFLPINQFVMPEPSLTEGVTV